MYNLTRLQLSLKTSFVMITMAMYVQSAHAQTPNNMPETTLDTIVVTATKTERPIDKVTASVSIVTEEDIERMGAITLKDVFNKTPGLIMQYGTFPAGSSASKSSINIRGMGATGSLWLMDGRRLAGEVKNPYDMDRIPASIIERIEIVKGPMSALYGADATGGIVNIITKQPQAGFSSQVAVSAGENSDGDGGNSQLSASMQGGKDKFYGSFYASTTRATPYEENESTTTTIGGGRHAPEDGIPAMPGFLNPKSPTGGKPFYVQADGSVKPKPLDPSKLQSDIAAVKSDFNRFKSQASSNISNNYRVPVTYREDADIDTIGGRAEYDITDKLTLGAEFNWFQEERNGVYRASFHPMAYMPPLGTKANPIVGHDANGNPISKRAGAIPAFDVPVNSYDENERLDLGVDASYELTDAADINLRIYRSNYEKRNKTTMNQYQDFGYPNKDKSASSGMNGNVDITSYELGSNWQINDNHLLTGGVEYRDEEREATVFSQSSDLDTRSVSYFSAYLQDDMQLSDDLGVTIGGRYDKYSQDAYVDMFGKSYDEKNDNKATFRLGMVKNINDNLNFRANFAQGYRVPDIRELFIQKQTPAGMQLGAYTIDPRFGKQSYNLQPESTSSYELGVSGDLAALTYGVNVFYNDIEDRISQVTKQGTSSSYYTFENISDAKTYGTELNLGYTLSDDVSSSLSWTELRTENKDTGQDLEYNPNRMLTAAVNWQVNPRFNVGVDAKHVGEQNYLASNGTKQVMKQTDDYTLVNLSSGYRLGSNQQAYLYGGINNIFDSEVDKKLGSDVGTYYYTGLKYEF